MSPAKKPRLSTAEAAALSGVSDRRLRVLCAEGRVSNAEKVGDSWVFDGKPIVSEAGRVRPSVIKMAKQKTTKGKKQ